MAASTPTAPQPTDIGPAAVPPSDPRRPGRTSVPQRVWRVLWRVLAGLALLLVLCVAGVLLALRSPSVQSRLVEQINAALDPPASTAPAASIPVAPGDNAAGSAAKQEPASGKADEAAPVSGVLRVRITHLSGPLPFGAALGLELRDGHGLWLRLPTVRFDWDWRALPGVVRITGLVVSDAVLLRPPQLPPGPPPEPAPPLTEKGLRQLLGQAVQALAQLPGWLPELRLERLALENAQLPASLLGATVMAASAAPVPLAAEASEKGSAEKNAPPQAASGAEGAAAAPPESGMSAPSLVAAAPAMLRADLNARATAGTTGARLQAEAGLAPATGAGFVLGGAACASASIQVDAALTPAFKDSTATLRATADLAAALNPATVVASGAPAPQANPNLPSDIPQTGGLPGALLGQGARLTLRLEGGLTAPVNGGSATALSGGLTELRLTAGPLAVEGYAGWASPVLSPALDPASGAWLRGPLDVALRLDMARPGVPAAADATAQPTPTAAPPGGQATASPLDMLRAPLQLKLTAQGPLGAPHMLLTLDCADLRASGHSLTGTTLRLEADPFNWTAALPTVQGWAAVFPAPAADFSPTGPEAASARGTADATAAPQNAAGPDLTLTLDLAAALDQRPLKAHTALFAVRTAAGLRAGLRELSALAAGVTLTGDVAALLPEGSPYPRLDGGVDVRVTDWQALSALLPGTRLGGEAGLALRLRSQNAPSQAAADPIPVGQAAAAAADQEVSLTWRVPRLSYSAAGAAPVELRGLTGAVRLTDLWAKALAEASLDLTELRQAEVRLGARLRAGGALRGPLTAELQTSGFVAARTELRWQPGSVAVERLEARLAKKNLGVTAAPGLRVHYGEAGLGLEGLDLRLSPSGRLRARAAKDAAGVTMQLSLENLDLTPWRGLAEALPEGLVTARINFNGKAAGPGGDLRLDVRNLHLPNSPLKPMHVILTGNVERNALALHLTLDPESVRALGGEVCRVEARLPLRFGPDGLPAPDMQGPLRGTVRWKGAVGPLWSLVPVADQRLGGQLDLAVDLGGSPAAPGLKGFVQMDRGRYENVQLGAQLQDINLRVDLEQQGAKAGKARLRLGAADGLGGSLRVAGQAGLDGAGLDIVTTLDRLRPLRRRDVRIDLSGRVVVTGSATAPEVRGEVRVNQGEVWLNKLAVTGSVTTLPISEAPAAASVADAAAKPAAAGQAAKPEGAGLLDLRLVMPGRFSVEGYGLKSIWRADMHVGGTPAAPVIDGQVEAARGSLEFIGKNFKLVRGRVGFAGGSPGNPMLDLLLSNETPELTAYIALTGTARKLQLALRSEPEMPRDEILAQILFGKSTSELGRLENLRLAAAVAQLAGFGSGGGGSFADFGRKTLGVDVLRLNTDSGRSGSGSSSEDGQDMTAGASVEMGKYLTEELYVGVQQGMKQGSTAFIIQWELTSRANLELRTEQGGTWGGFRWKYNY